MLEVPVLQPQDADNRTIIVDNLNKKISAQFLTTRDSVTIEASVIQGLLFRRTENADHMLVCTGVKAQNQWYGDSPNGEFFDPWSGQTLRNRHYKENTPRIALEVGGDSAYLSTSNAGLLNIGFQNWKLVDPTDNSETPIQLNENGEIGMVIGMERGNPFTDYAYNAGYARLIFKDENGSYKVAEIPLKATRSREDGVQVEDFIYEDKDLIRFRKRFVEMQDQTLDQTHQWDPTQVYQDNGYSYPFEQ